MISCQQNSSNSAYKEAAFTLGGSGLGAYIGSQFGKGSGKTVATLAGAAIGGFAGNNIASMLSKEDQQKLSTNTIKTVETGKSQSFHNPNTGISSTTKVVDNGKKGTASNNNSSGTFRRSSQHDMSETSSVANDTCKTVEQSITLKDGTIKQQNVEMCKGPKGWKQVS